MQVKGLIADLNVLSMREQNQASKFISNANILSHIHKELNPSDDIQALVFSVYFLLELIHSIVFKPYKYKVFNVISKRQSYVYLYAIAFSEIGEIEAR